MTPLLPPLAGGRLARKPVEQASGSCRHCSQATTDQPVGGVGQQTPAMLLSGAALLRAQTGPGCRQAGQVATVRLQVCQDL